MMTASSWAEEIEAGLGVYGEPWGKGESKSIEIRTTRTGQVELRAAQTEHDKSYYGETDMEVDRIAWISAHLQCWPRLIINVKVVFFIWELNDQRRNRSSWLRLTISITGLRMLFRGLQRRQKMIYTAGELVESDLLTCGRAWGYWEVLVSEGWSVFLSALLKRKRKLRQSQQWTS